MYSLNKYIVNLTRSAKTASYLLPSVSTETKNKALKAMASALLKHKSTIITENHKDIRAAKRSGMTKSLIDRLTLTDTRIKLMAESLREISKLKDPIGETISSRRRPNGLIISKVRMPIGVIAIIYESRPNVTSDCIGLCLKSSNAVILKGGSEALNSNNAIFRILRDAAKNNGIPKESINLIQAKNRKAVDIFLSLAKYIDVVIPRGGEGLIRNVAKKSKIPVIKHYKGVCHTYVDKTADLRMAEQISLNAKIQRPSVCNAMETLLVHKDVAKKFLPGTIKKLKESGVEIRGCPLNKKICGQWIKNATLKDWEEEYLDLILSVKVIKNTKEAIEHINQFGSGHSDAIITKTKKNAEEFLKLVDSACVYVNASTRFTDGYEFGLGSEIGISTDKLHARGPMALEELTTYKYTVIGKGQVRK